MERRFFQVEVRADEGEQAAAKIAGYAAVFGQQSVLLYGQFREVIERGAFAGDLTGDVRALWNHDTNMPLGRTKAGTLALEEDAHGLRVEIDPPATSWGRDAVESIRRGDVDQMSFGFDVVDDDWAQLDDGTLVRTLRKVKLYEVSPVVFPAYPQTAVSVRGGDAALGDMPAIPERFRGGDDGSEAERAQRRTAVRRRRLAVLTLKR